MLLLLDLWSSVACRRKCKRTTTKYKLNNIVYILHEKQIYNFYIEVFQIGHTEILVHTEIIHKFSFFNSVQLIS